MSDEGDETFGKIEETQAALRDSIEKAKALASRSEELIRRHRRETREPEAGPPGPG